MGKQIIYTLIQFYDKLLDSIILCTEHLSHIKATLKELFSCKLFGHMGSAQSIIN